MSLRSRLLLTLGAVLAVALVVAGVILVGVTRASLLERMDAELTSIASASTPLQRMLDLASADDAGGRRLAIMRLDRTGSVLRAFPSGFTTDPDPLPSIPVWPEGIPAGAYGTVFERPSVDGSMGYHVILEQGRLGAIVAIAAPLTMVDAATATLIRTLVAVDGAAVLVILVIAWAAIRHDLLPIERIAASAERIAGGDLSHRAGVPHDGTEVGRLGAAFDTMLDRIQGAFTQQQAALDAKEQSEERLRRFVADASHELRTPITAVRGYADLYRAGGLSEPGALDDAMDRIGTESRRMGALVDDLLLLARLDQGRPLRRDAVDLSRIAADAAADLRAVQPSRPVAAAIEPGLVVTGDEDRLRQVVGNLVGNVRTHTPPGSAVEILLAPAPGDDPMTGPVVELRVVDHGQGIAPEHAARIFDRFYRADAGRSRESGGTGLGLAIVASIVAAHGGRLWHEATPEGGATFGIRLPLTATSQPVPGSV